MLADVVIPQFIGDRDSLDDRFREEGRQAGMQAVDIEDLIATVPRELRDAGCFLDRLTSFWRYEFQTPAEVDGSIIWGANVWQPVSVLFRVMRSAKARLSQEQQQRYFGRLVNPHKHEDTLSEFMPIVRLDPSVEVAPEHLTGVGGRDVDWRIRSADGPVVLLDVKNRIRDLLEMMARIALGEKEPAPAHDVALIFRGIEHKLAAANPDEQLQGAWINTDLKQEGSELAAAFDALDATKVHFAILGGWDRGVTILSRREQDKPVLCRLFQEEESEAFRFAREIPPETLADHE